MIFPTFKTPGKEIKTKFITAMRDYELTHIVNQFIKEHTVISIDFATACTNHETYHSVMIIYEE